MYSDRTGGKPIYIRTGAARKKNAVISAPGRR